jgi:CRP-like cAMP-binding protein
MTTDNILPFIRHITDFSDEDLSIIMQKFEPKSFPKKTNLLTAGNTAKEVYFIISGCMRLFYEKDGEDISAYFFTENMFAGAYDSFTSQQPSRHSIETQEECGVLCISYQNLQDLFVEVPKMNEFVRKVMEERFVSLHQLFTSLILDSPEERYVNLQRTRPELINRIPQHQIATFLGMTPVSLSRIKSRVAKK